MHRYRLYGLTVETDFEIHAVATDRHPPDITATFVPDGPTPTTPPAGEVISTVPSGPGTNTMIRTETGYVVTFPDLLEAKVTGDLSRVELMSSSADKRPIAELLFAGVILTKIMTLAGACVLHGSAVELDGAAIAFVGPSGGGKSTMAALMCAAGGRLITDDVLRLMPAEAGWMCPAGSTQLRLREAAQELAEEIDGLVTETPDRRRGVETRGSDGAWPMRAFVFQAPSRASKHLEVTRLSEQDALMRLTSYPRTLGWRDPKVLAQTFRWNARLAREVPAYQAIVPWGPPFDPNIAPMLLEELNAGRSST